MKIKKLEVMVVDDESVFINLFREYFKDIGYSVVTADDSYEAIHNLAIRIHMKKRLPDIYLCDMLDLNRYYAFFGDNEIHLSMAFNLYNYLMNRGIRPEFFIADTCDISPEDLKTASYLRVPLLMKDLDRIEKYFPDISGIKREDALNIYRENFARLMDKRENR